MGLTWFTARELCRSRYIVGMMWRARIFPFPVEWSIDYLRDKR